MQSENPEKFSDVNLTSGSDSDPVETDWNKELINAICQRTGESEANPEKYKLYRIKICLDERADVNATHGKNRDTILHTAIKKNYQIIAKYLLARGARTDITNKKGYTAVTLAETLGNREVANILKTLDDQHIQPTINQSSLASNPQPIDDQQPSTSRDMTFIPTEISSTADCGNHGVNSDQVIPGLRRKLATDHEHLESKRRRLELQNARQRESQPGSASNVNSGSATPSAETISDLNEEGNNQNQTSRFDRKMTYAAGGLKSSFHGVVYQLKHLGFTLLRTMQPERKVSFLLSTERVDVGKFDDLVLEYQNNQGQDVDLFLQLKHSQNINRQVNVYDLLEKEDGDFCIPKYFVSWREIKKSPLFSDNVSKHVVLGTNIDLNLEGLQNAAISCEEVIKPVECLEMVGTKEETRCYKFTADGQLNRKLYEKLKETSDVHTLARELVEHVLQRKKITLVGLFKQYHAALGEQVIDSKNNKFFQNFIKNSNLTPKAKIFREIFSLEFSKQKNKFSKHKVSQDNFWKEVENSTLELSKNFGEKFELSAGPQLTNIPLFTQEFIKLLNNATPDRVVKISKSIYRKNARKGSVERVVADNIDKLAGHVLIAKSGKIKIRSQFFDDSIQSMGNIEEFKNSLKSRFGSKFNELHTFEFEINNFETCEEEELYTKIELPDGEMAEADITEFLDVFILAVNLPDEVQLGEMMTRQIGEDSKFNLLDSDLIGRTFLTKIVDWFKEKGKTVGEGKYLSYKGGQVFFKEMENQINTLKSIGVTSVYWEELKEFGINFDCENVRLKSFLSENSAAHRILILMAPKEPLLSTLRVCQTLVQMEKYARNDSFIFIRLRTLSLRGIKDEVIRAFQSQRSHHLLIIECDSAGMKQHPYRLWFSLCRAIENVDNVKKTIILIVRGNRDLAASLAGDFESVYKTHVQEDDDIIFNNLTRDSQHKLLKKRVINFQGYGDRISLRKLLGIEDLDNIGFSELKDVGELLDSSTLVELIRGEDEMRIGSDLEGLGEIGDYYINRTIVRHVVIKDDILQDQQIPDLLAISGIDRELQGEICQKGEAPASARNSRNFTILHSEQEAKQFEVLCEQNRHRNIHWLEGESGRYIWKQTVGDINYLLQYRDAIDNYDNNGRTTVTHFNEEQFAALDGPVIVSDTAGMGKSTIFTYLAGIIKKTEPDLLVMKIDLNRHTTALAEVNKNSNCDLGVVDEAIEFVVEKLSSLQTDVEKKVFKAIIKKRGKVALIFDGFDEISPTYEDTVINILQALAKYRIKKLFVATRPHMRGALENKLKTFCYELQPFSAANQEDFLLKFWRNELRLDEFDRRTENRARNYAKTIITKLAESINDRMNKFTGIPIQIKLVAEIFQNRGEWRLGDFPPSEEFTDSTDNILNLPAKIDLVYLYETFVDMKFDIFFKKRGGNLADLAVIEGRKLRYDTFIDAHERLALDVFFDEEKVKQLIPTRQNVKQETYLVQERTGIITQFINGKPQFGHRTYAEYFAAKFLSDKLKERNHNESVRRIFVGDIFLEENYQNLRAFMNGLLSVEHTNSFEDDFWKSHLIESRNSANRSIFHVAAAEGNELLINLFLHSLNTNPANRKHLIDLEDRYGRTAVYWAAGHGHSQALKLLVENGDAMVNLCSKSDGQTPLHAASTTGRLEIVKYLLEKEANINSNNTNGQTPLHAAALSGQLDIVKYLLDKEATVDSRTNGGETPLFLAIFAGKFEITVSLLDKRADVNSQTNGGIVPLHMAAFNGALDLVKYLVKNGAKLDAPANDGRTPLYVAAMNGKLDVVKYLVEKKVDPMSKTNDGQTPLHVAAAAGKLNVVRYLLEKGITVDIQATDGRTPLYVAATTGKLDVVKYLIDKKANVNSQTNDRETPLYVAAATGELEVVQYLIDEKVDVNFQNINGWTPLHAATLAGKIDVVKYLLGNKAIVNTLTNTGDSPLHAAALMGELDVVKSLLDNGADVNAPANDGKTPLNNAAFAGKLDVVKYLLDNEADVNCRTEEGQTPLHAATFAGHFDTLKYLLEKDADINSRTNDGITPLYAATVDGKLDIVRYLLDKKADVNVQTNDGITPLHAAAFTGRLDVIEYLLNNKADVDSRTNDHKTPLHIAAFNGLWDIVKHLLDKNASVNLRTTQGDTPLHVAAVAGKLNVVKVLIEKGADVNSQANDGQKPLDLAISTGKLDVVKNRPGSSVIITTDPHYSDCQQTSKEDQGRLIPHTSGTRRAVLHLIKLRDICESRSTCKNLQPSKTGIFISMCTSLVQGSVIYVVQPRNKPCPSLLLSMHTNLYLFLVKREDCLFFAKLFPTSSSTIRRIFMMQSIPQSVEQQSALKMVASPHFFTMFLVLVLFSARFCVAESPLDPPHNRNTGTANNSSVDKRIWHESTIESSFDENLENFVRKEASSRKIFLATSDPDPLGPLENLKHIPSTQVLRPETGLLPINSSELQKRLRDIFSVPASQSNKSNETNINIGPNEEVPYFLLPPGNSAVIPEELWFKELFSKEAGVDLSVRIVDCSRIVQKFGEMFTSKRTWLTNGRMLGCPLGFKMCLSLCCPVGEALARNKCVKDNADIDHMTPVRISICTNNSQNVHTFINDNYVYDWMVSRDIKNFSLLEHGLLSAPNLIKGRLLGPENYCLFREPRSSNYLAKVWSPEARKSAWETFCCICIILIMLVILICYNIIPELKNLHGVIFQSYVATDIASYVCVLGLDITTGSKTYSNLFTVFKNTAYYTGCACALWLNVMSIAIWRTFRSFRFIDHNIKKRETKRFIWYAIYAWGTPAVLVLICVGVIHYEPNMKDVYGRTLTWWCNLGLSVFAFICNIFLYIWTAFTIRNLKKGTAHLTDGVNKHQEVAKQWLNMYVKLFVIMTGPMGGGIVPLVLWLVWPTPLMTGLLYAVQLVQSILTFYVFLWKDNIRRSLRDHFSETFRRLHDFVERSESTATSESVTSTVKR